VSTTYGTPFKTEDYKYSIDTTKSAGFVNGDTQASVLGDRFLNYINTGAKTDANNDKVNTQNAGTYELQGSASKNLSDYTVHITNGKSTVNKAKLTLTVGDVNTVYGNDFDKSQYTYTISGNANGDTDETLKNNQISVTYTNTGEKTDANNDKVKTQDVGDWKLIGNFTVAGDTANNYDVTYVDGTSTVTPAEIHLKLNDVSTTYGTAFTDTNTYGYDPSKLVMANGDSTEVVTKAIGNGDITYTNTGDAADPDKIAKGAKTQDAGTGYQLTGTTERTLQNYTVKIDGADASIDKATLKLKVGDYTEAYGAADKVGADLKQTEVTGEQNGDDLADLVSEIGIHNTSEALLSNTRTNNVKYKADGSLDSYRIDTQLDKDTLKNYNLELSEGTMTLTPVAITVDNEMIQTYGSADRSFKEIATPPLVNGDTISTAGLTMAPKAGGAYETNRAGRTTADAGKYKDDLAFSGGGIVHADGTTDASKNYKVTIKGDIIVNTADLTVTTKDVTTPFGTVKFTTSGVQGLTNGDEKNVSDLKFNYGSYGNAYLDNNSYTNAPGRYEFTTETTNQYLDFLKNYNILGGDAAVTITPVDKPVKPDITPDRPNPVSEGKGEVEEPSMDDFRGEEEHRDGGRTWYREKKSIPFFKVLDGKVTNYGTFDVESMPEKVEITSSGMRLPEPDQPETQHREYTTTLTLPGGDGTYRLVYNGVSFDIHPVDTAALRLLEAGDPKKNKELSEAALHTGFQKMGLGLEDLKAVYVRFN